LDKSNSQQQLLLGEQHFPMMTVVEKHKELHFILISAFDLSVFNLCNNSSSAIVEKYCLPNDDCHQKVLFI
jgi:hypothetical protein